MNSGTRKFSAEFLVPLYHAFQEAWHDQEPGLSLPLDLFELRLYEKLKLWEEVSILALEKGVVEGFILHTINQYHGSLCAYNGGTGVVPSARGNGLTKKLYDLILPEIKALNVQKVVLEVLKKNSTAIHIYEAIGFEISRGYKCFAKRGYFYSAFQTVIKQTEKYNPAYTSFWDIDPCFLDQTQQLKHNIHNEVILESYQEDHLTGYIIFQPQLGRVSQLAVNPKYRGKGIGRFLITKAQERSATPYLTIMNIPEDAESYISFLENIGFVNELDQYEMELTL